jgi:hypothetical protein
MDNARTLLSARTLESRLKSSPVALFRCTRIHINMLGWSGVKLELNSTPIHFRNRGETDNIKEGIKCRNFIISDYSKHMIWLSPRGMDGPHPATLLAVAQGPRLHSVSSGHGY